MAKPTQKDIIRERWNRGRLGYKLHAGQKKIEELVFARKHQLFVGEISRQFGKSYWLVKTALEAAIRKPKARIKYATAFLTDLEEFILPAFDKILDDCPRDLRPVFKSQKSKFVFHNGAEIKLVGLDRKPNGLRGNAIDLIILDEAGFMSRLDYIYKSVIIPATTHRPDCRILVFSTPPDTPAHEFLDYVQKAELEGGYLKLTIYDNPMVDEKTITRLMAESGGEVSTTWRREYLCEHVTDANLAIVSDWNDAYASHIPRDEYYGFYHKYVMMDLGVSDQTAALFGYYDFIRAKFIIENEFVISGPQMNTKILQAHLKLKELDTWTDIRFKPRDLQKLSELEMNQIEILWLENQPQTFRRVSDNNNPLLLQDLSHLHRLHFTATDKGRLNEMVNALKILVRSNGLNVNPSCKQTVGSLKYGVWDKNREKFAHSKVYGHFDALAALIYGVRNLNQQENPIPRDFKMDTMNQILLPSKVEPGSIGVLKNAFGLRGKR